MRFVKLHGIGNDYIYLNGFESDFTPPDDPAELSRRLADRHYGIGGDGLILVLPPDDGVDAQFKIRIFNADGSEAEMCGNGIRCACKLAYDRGITCDNPIQVQTGNGVLSLHYRLGSDGKVNRVTVNMGKPILQAGQIPVQIDGLHADAHVIDHYAEQLFAWQSPPCPSNWPSQCRLDWRMTCVSMGNPHAVFYCGDLEMLPLEQVGPFFEHARIFPNRMNVHFIQVLNSDKVKMKTWERGSGITLACGTGASAVCVAGVLTGRTNRSITAHLPGGNLTMEWSGSDEHLYMTGPATEVFEGTIEVHTVAGS